MYSDLYKFVVCLVMALCAIESFDYIFNNVLPNPDISVMGMIITCWILGERLYIILWLESRIKK